MQMAEDIFEQLTELLVRDREFEELSNAQDVYCPFEALGVARHEIRHSNFLADLITPAASHGFGELFLREFIDALMEAAGNPELRLRSQFDELAGAMVFREWRNIDLIVTIPTMAHAHELVLVVEIKIESGEADGQLEAYEKKARERWPASELMFFYLTPDQSSPSRENWTEIGFSALLSRFSETVRRLDTDSMPARMVRSYIKMMRRRYVEDDKLELLAQQIWSRHRTALEFLMDRQPNFASALLDELSSEETLTAVRDGLNGLGFELTPIVDGQTNRYLRIAVSDWDQIQGMMSGEGWVSSKRVCLFEIELSETALLIRFVVGRGPDEIRRRFINATDEADVDAKRRKNITSDFTRIGSKSVLGKKVIEQIRNEGLEPKETETAKGAIVDYLVEHIVAYDRAFSRM